MRILFILLMIIVLSSCVAEDDETILQGYVESHQLHLAPFATGKVEGLYVKEGDQVQAGKILFTLNMAREQAQLNEKLAQKAASMARLENLKKGGREEEIRAASEILKEAQAARTFAEQTYHRTKDLVDRGVMAVARLDQDKATWDAARARVTEAQSRLALVRLPAREDVIKAAEREVDIYQAAIKRAEADMADRTVIAPTDGRIEAIYRRVGELASPAQPVVSLVSPDLKRVRVFVPEKMLARVRHGAKVSLTCDNCDTGLTGHIVFIADQAEFTPPVIFTEKERAKLVYMIEVQPDNPGHFLNGQPVQVLLP